MKLLVSMRALLFLSVCPGAENALLSGLTTALSEMSAPDLLTAQWTAWTTWLEASKQAGGHENCSGLQRPFLGEPDEKIADRICHFNRLPAEYFEDWEETIKTLSGFREMDTTTVHSDVDAYVFDTEADRIDEEMGLKPDPFDPEMEPDTDDIEAETQETDAQSQMYTRMEAMLAELAVNITRDVDATAVGDLSNSANSSSLLECSGLQRPFLGELDEKTADRICQFNRFPAEYFQDWENILDVKETETTIQKDLDAYVFESEVGTVDEEMALKSGPFDPVMQPDTDGMEAQTQETDAQSQMRTWMEAMLAELAVNIPQDMDAAAVDDQSNSANASAVPADSSELARRAPCHPTKMVGGPCGAANEATNATLANDFILDAGPVLDARRVLIATV